MSHLPDARLHTKNEFRKHQGERDPIKIRQMIETANEAANIIRRNIVQGVKAENKDVYRLSSISSLFRKPILQN